MAFERNGPRPGGKKQRPAASGGRAALPAAGPAAGRAKALGRGVQPCAAAGRGLHGPVAGQRCGALRQPGPEHPAGANSGTNAGFYSLLRAAAGTAWPGGDRAARRVQELDAGPGRLVLLAPSGLHGAEITLRFPSVGATETLLLAAACARGRTVLRGAAREPEVADLADFLNRCGGSVEGAGSSTLIIEGRRALGGCVFSPLPDRIFASTLACAAAAAGGRVELIGCSPELYAPVLEILAQMGCRVERGGESVQVARFGRLYGAGRVFTGVYPALATDAAPPLAAAMLCAEGESSIEDVIFERRFACAEGFAALGGRVNTAGRVLHIRPGGALRGTRLSAPDLRGGAALVLAALAAQGRSQIGGVAYLDRGYADFTEILASLGARIYRETKPV